MLEIDFSRADPTQHSQLDQELNQPNQIINAHWAVAAQVRSSVLAVLICSCRPIRGGDLLHFGTEKRVIGIELQIAELQTEAEQELRRFEVEITCLKVGVIPWSTHVDRE
jgi:hypothetical protein